MSKIRLDNNQLIEIDERRKITLSNGSAVVIAEFNKNHDKLGRFAEGSNISAGKINPGVHDITMQEIDDLVGERSSDYFEFRPGGDPIMSRMVTKIGYNKKPALIKKDEVASMKKAGWKEMYRGYHGQNAKAYMNEYNNSLKPRLSCGVRGSGMYMTTDKNIANFYASIKSGTVGNYLLSPRARGISYEKARTLMSQSYDRLIGQTAAHSKKSGYSAKEFESLTRKLKNVHGDVGRWAALSGFDYIHYEGSNHAQEMVILNRGMIGAII